ncbi:MAG: hypothetical protein ABI670_13460 [Chloroflexota bacterium]
MDTFTSFPQKSLKRHDLETYTSDLEIQGVIFAAFGRVSDMVNRKDRDYIVVQEARITPLGQTPNQRALTTPLMVAQQHVHFISVAPQYDEPAAPKQQDAQHGRDFVIKKVPTLCYVLTDTFVIYGRCHLLHGANLENLLETGGYFIPITDATVYLKSPTAATWFRELVILHKEKIQVMYVIDRKTTNELPDDPMDAGLSPLRRLAP